MRPRESGRPLILRRIRAKRNLDRSSTRRFIGRAPNRPLPGSHLDSVSSDQHILTACIGWFDLEFDHWVPECSMSNCSRCSS